ncbi:MAG TPA: FAD synthetase family protein [Treponemataceae bacterium]|nr:FAD synthetase family protein [Treponemataceae bacterium]
MHILHWKDLLDSSNCNSPAKLFFSENCSSGTAITIGAFDGMHRGHQVLCKSVLAIKKKSTNAKKNVKAGIVTFNRSPRALKQKDNFLGDISTLRLRTDFFAAQGFDFCIVIDFSHNFSKLKGHDFLTVLRNSCSMQFLAVGTDFRCGHGLDTGVFEIEHYCSQYGLQFEVCAEMLYKGMRISSSAVRSAVQRGNMALAASLLGYNYVLDAHNYKWRLVPTRHKRKKSAPFSLIAHKSDSSQVLPPVGIYPVNTAGFDTVLYADSKFLHLEIPLEQAKPATVKKIEFTNY